MMIEFSTDAAHSCKLTFDMYKWKWSSIVSVIWVMYYIGLFHNYFHCTCAKFTTHQRLCDFLLVRHSNLGPILHRFGDIASFWCSWPHPYSTHLGVFPLHQMVLFFCKYEIPLGLPNSIAKFWRKLVIKIDINNGRCLFHVAYGECSHNDE